MFNQLNNSDTECYGGTGLGLSTVKGFIVMISFEINYESQNGKKAAKKVR
jgi:signal transduction histidine kinase